MLLPPRQQVHGQSKRQHKIANARLEKDVSASVTPTRPHVHSMTGHYVLLMVLWDGRNIQTSTGDAFFLGWDPDFSEGRVGQIGFHGMEYGQECHTSLPHLLRSLSASSNLGIVLCFHITDLKLLQSNNTTQILMESN